MPSGEGPSVPDHYLQRWKLFVDGSSSSVGSGARLVVISLDHFKNSQALCFDFKASNNEAKYEALIASLDLTRELGVDAIKVFSDLMLIINQVIWEFQAK